MGINIHEVQQKNSSKLEFRTVLLIFDNVFAVRTRLELVTPCVTGMYSIQLN